MRRSSQGVGGAVKERAEGGNEAGAPHLPPVSTMTWEAEESGFNTGVGRQIRLQRGVGIGHDGGESYRASEKGVAGKVSRWGCGTGRRP